MPTSLSRRRYVLPVAPEITRQLEPCAVPPSVGQRSQRYWNDIGVEPDHVPAPAVRVRFSAAVPSMVGSPVLFGGTSARAEPGPGSSAAVSAAATPRGKATRTISRRSL